MASLSTAIKLDNSKDMIINRAVKISFIESAVKYGAIPYSQQEFEWFYKQGLDVFEVNKTKLEMLVSEIYKVKAGLDKKLSVKKIPLNFIELY